MKGCSEACWVFLIYACKKGRSIKVIFFNKFAKEKKNTYNAGKNLIQRNSINKSSAIFILRPYLFMCLCLYVCALFLAPFDFSSQFANDTMYTNAYVMRSVNKSSSTSILCGHINNFLVFSRHPSRRRAVSQCCATIQLLRCQRQKTFQSTLQLVHLCRPLAQSTRIRRRNISSSSSRSRSNNGSCLLAFAKMSKSTRHVLEFVLVYTRTHSYIYV